MSLVYEYLRIDDTTYAYTANGSGEVLVLLHGFTGSSETWQAFIEKWKKDYRVITIDLPGHGKTTGEANLRMAEVCRHLTMLFDHLAIEKCHLLGYSMGGRTALSFAIWYPVYIESLLLESASPGLPTEQERAERTKKDTQLAARLIDGGMEAFVNFWEDIPLFATQQSLPEKVKQQVRAERLGQNQAGLAASLTSIGTGEQPDWWEKLTDLALPVCLIVGEDDQKFVQVNRQMSEQLQQGSYEVVPDAGHAVHIERPEAFSQIVQQFIQQK